MGLSKDLPSIVQAAESVSRASAAGCLHTALFTLRDGKAIPIRAPSSWFLTTSTVYSSTTLRPLQAAADPGVHRVSFRCETEFPAVRLLPFEAFPPPTAAQAAETNLRFCAGSRHWIDLGTCVPSTAPFTANLAPSSFFGPRGLAPSSGPLLTRPFPAVRARCSLGLVRSVRSPSCPPPPHRER